MHLKMKFIFAFTYIYSFYVIISSYSFKNSQ